MDACSGVHSRQVLIAQQPRVSCCVSCHDLVDQRVQVLFVHGAPPNDAEPLAFPPPPGSSATSRRRYRPLPVQNTRRWFWYQLPTDRRPRLVRRRHPCRSTRTPPGPPAPLDLCLRRLLQMLRPTTQAFIAYGVNLVAGGNRAVCPFISDAADVLCPVVPDDGVTPRSRSALPEEAAPVLLELGLQAPFQPAHHRHSSPQYSSHRSVRATCALSIPSAMPCFAAVRASTAASMGPSSSDENATEYFRSARKSRSQCATRCEF